MENKQFTKKDIDQIREIAIKLYVENDPNGLNPDNFRIDNIAEATFLYLKKLGLII